MKWIILLIMMIDAVVLIGNVLYWVMPVFRESILKKLVFPKVRSYIKDMEDESRIKKYGYSENIQMCQKKLVMFIVRQALIFTMLFMVALIVGKSPQ